MGTRIFVGNLSFGTSEDGLRQLFESGGRRVREVQLVTDRMTGKPRGFGFVEMESDSDAQAAIQELDGVELDGRTLAVNEARERAPRSFGGGGGGGGGGGMRSFGGGDARPRSGGGGGGGPSRGRRGGGGGGGGSRRGGRGDGGDDW